MGESIRMFEYLAANGYMKTGQVATALGVTVEAVEKYTKRGLLKSHKVTIPNDSRPWRRAYRISDIEDLRQRLVANRQRDNRDRYGMG